MASLESKFKPFDEFGHWSKHGLDEKPTDKEEPERSQIKRDHVLTSPLLNLYSKWKQKWTSNPIKVRSMLLS